MLVDHGHIDFDVPHVELLKKLTRYGNNFKIITNLTHAGGSAVSLFITVSSPCAGHRDRKHRP